MINKAGQKHNKLSSNPSLPFNILQEDSFFILVYKDRPFWIVTNEVGKEIAVRYYLKSSQREITKFLRKRYSSPASIENETKEFIEDLKNAEFHWRNSLSENLDSKNGLKGILFLVTQACNLSCYHCSLGNSPSVSSKISKEFFYKIIDDVVSLGAKTLLVSGGEPLLRPDLFDLLDYAAQRLRVTLLTNGTLIGQKEARQIKETGVAEVIISIDGITPQTHDHLRGKGSFESIIKGIDFMKKEGLEERIDLSFCLSKINIEEALEFPKFAENIGVKRVTFLPLKKLGKASDIWEDLKPDKKQYEKFLINLYEIFFHQGFTIKVNSPLSGFHPAVRPGEQVSTCPFGTQLIVNGDGDIYPCPALFRPEFYLGNVFETRIEEAANSSKFKTLKNKYKARIERITKCKSCIWRSFCQGGCTSTVYLEKGTIWETDDFCKLRDKLYRKAIIRAARKKLLRRESIHAEVCQL